MFNMTGSDLPFRSRKDLARAQQLRGLNRRRTGPGNAAPMINDPWLGMIDPSQWRPDFLKPLQSSLNRFEDVDEAPTPRQPSMNGAKYGSPFAKDSNRRPAYAQDSVPFDKAAAALFEALQCAIKHCPRIYDHFQTEIERSSVAAWAPPKAVDMLWNAKMDWNGVHQADSEKRPSETITYRQIVKDLMAAIEDLKSTDHPSPERFEQAEMRLNRELVRMTLNKLQVTLQGIEELVQSVRKDRTLMPPLVKDMQAAKGLLSDIEDLWLPSKRSTAGRANKAWEDVDYRWPWTRDD